MKKTHRKLSLNRTSVRDLSKDQLAKTAGGDSDWGCTASCNCTQIFCPTQYTCMTCHNTCDCNLADQLTQYINPQKRF